MSEPRGAILDGAAVAVGVAEPIDAALKRLARRVERADLIGELQRRRYALSRVERRREKDRRARARTIRALNRRAARAACRPTED